MAITTHDVTRYPSCVLFYVGCSFFPWLYVTLLSSHARSNWSSPSFSSFELKTFKVQGYRKRWKGFETAIT